MLLTVPILYYKPIQEQALKIKAGKKDRREEKWRIERSGGGVLQETWVFKSHSCLKAHFVSLRGSEAVLKWQKCFDRLSTLSGQGAVNIYNNKEVAEMFLTVVLKVTAPGDDLKAPLALLRR